MLTLAEVRKAAPAAFATHPASFVSEKYRFISTAQILEPLLADGWGVSSASQRRVNREGRNPAFTRHLIRLRHQDVKPVVGGVLPEVLIINSHDRQCRMKIMAGLFRLVCSNGLVIGLETGGGSVVHTGNSMKVRMAIDDALEKAESSHKIVNKMINRILKPTEMKKFARSAYSLAYDNEEPRFDVSKLLEPLREEDKSDDLWTVYNRVQEHLVKGGISYGSPGQRLQSTRALTHIGRSTDLNEGLWNLATKSLGKAA